MTGFSPSEAALEGFRLTRERPATMLAWAVFYILGVVVIGALMLVSLGGPFIDFVKKGGFSNFDYQGLADVLERSWLAFVGLVGVIFLFSSVLLAGVYRLVIRPNEPGLAHLRFGADELRLTVVSLALFFLGIICFAFVNVVGAGVAQQSGMLAGILAAIVVAAPMIFMGVRLMLVTPMTFATGKLAFRDGWAISKGHFWSLLGMFLLSIVFYVIVWILVFIIHGSLMALGGGPEVVYSFGREGGVLALIVLVIALFLEGMLPVLQVVLISAPLAVAYRELAGPQAPAAAIPAQV